MISSIIELIIQRNRNGVVPMKILLLGATGRVGTQLLTQALADGHDVHALIRNPAKLPVQSENLKVIASDVRSQHHLLDAAQGVDAIISSLSTDGSDVLSTSMPLIIDAMNVHHIQRIVVVSTAGILQSRANPELLRYESGESKRGLTRAVLEHRKAWELLARTDLQWTIVCPTYLPEGERTGTFRIDVNVLPIDGLSISVEDTAAFAYQQLFSAQYVRQRVGIAY